MVAFALLAGPLYVSAPARADVGTTIIERCTHGKSVSGFSQQAYRRALQELPTEVEEYSDCANVIRRAQLAAAGGSSAGGLGAGAVATPLTPAEQRRVGAIKRTGTQPLLIGNELVHPGVVHADISSALSSLPNALLAVLAFLLACAIALAGRAIGARVARHRNS